LSQVKAFIRKVWVGVTEHPGDKMVEGEGNMVVEGYEDRFTITLKDLDLPIGKGVEKIELCFGSEDVSTLLDFFEELSNKQTQKKMGAK